MKKILLCAILLFSITGCSSLVDNDQLNNTLPPFELSAAQSIGQTFVPHYAGLNGVQIFLTPQQASQGKLRFTLRTHPEGKELASGELDLAAFTAPQFYSFNFPPVNTRNPSPLYLELTIPGEGVLQVGAGGKTSYIDGGMVVNQVPVEAQMTFRLAYNNKLLTVGLLREVLGWVVKLLLFGCLFLVPGLALLHFLWPASKRLAAIEQFSLAVGASVCLYPVLIYATDLVGVHLGVLYAWIPFLTGLIYLGIVNWKPFWTKSRSLSFQSLAPKWKEEKFWQTATLLIILTLIVGVRFWVIRGLAGPMWGDSYQHTVISQLLVDNHGLFNSWAPYVQLQTFTYHFGFHSAVAVYHWFSGMDVLYATLWVGQIINGLAVIVLYPWVMRLSNKNRWGAVIAVLIAGLLTTHPMFYVNWGRYTQLTAQVILPVAMVFLLELFNQEKISPRLIVLGGLGMAGIALTHYRILILVLPLILFSYLLKIRKDNLKSRILNLGILILTTGLFLTPWMVRTLSNTLGKNLANKLGTVVASPYTVFGFLDVFYKYLPGLIWVLFFLAILYALWTHNLPIILLSAWGIVGILMANPGWLGLPGANLMDVFTLMIGFYIPVTVAIGIFFNELTGKWLRWRSFAAVFLALIISAAGVMGAMNQKNIANPQNHAYLTWPDRLAIDWIRNHTPADSKVLVNYEFSFNGTSITGIDGGWWIPLLALRDTNLPPLAAWSEQGVEQNFYVNRRNEAQQIAQKDPNSEEFIDFVTGMGYRYIYIGQNPLFAAVFTPEKFIASSRYSLVYRQDQVWIFKILP